MAATLTPDFSISIAINSKLLKCPDIKTTGSPLFFISSNISLPSISKYFSKFDCLICYITI